MRLALLLSSVGALCLAARSRELAAQADSTRFRAWAFARLGGASSAPVSVATSGGGILTSASVGLAASDGLLLAMVKASDSFQFMYGPEIRDWGFLAGVRSRGDRVFVSGAAGVARARPFENGDDTGGGPVGREQTSLAYDFSVHWDYRVAGLSFSISGVSGAAKRSYVAALLGFEAGWFGR